MMLCGAIFKNTIPDESDEERRELERMVAEAAQAKPKPPARGHAHTKVHKKEDVADAATAHA
jgi:hypothetical protein